MKRMMFAILLLVLVFGVVPQAAAQNKPQPLEAVSLTEGITPPQLSEVVNPEYTAEAKKKRIEGEVQLTIVIDKRGNVVDARVLKGLGYGLDESAIAAVKEWKYRPAEKDGAKIAVKLETTVNFYLRD